MHLVQTFDVLAKWASGQIGRVARGGLFSGSAIRIAGLGRGMLVNNNYPPPPLFLVSVDSKAFNISVSDLESILRGGSASVDSEGVSRDGLVQPTLGKNGDGSVSVAYKGLREARGFRM